MRFKSIKLNSKQITSDFETVLKERGLYWLLDCEIEDVELEISRDKVIWKDGIFYAGIWKGDIWEKGDWYYGIWTKGIWKGGTFHNGIWLDGIFEKGDFISGKVEGGVFKNLEDHNEKGEKEISS